MTALSDESASKISRYITDSVARFYETHPYPNYPLFSRPKIEDGYLSNSILAKRLQVHTQSLGPAELATDDGDDIGNILLAGCGDMLPYIIGRGNSGKSSILAVDLSKQSLIRARIRMGVLPHKVNFRQQDLLETLRHEQLNGRFFSHVDAYGVLHHLADPSIAVNHIAKTLTAAGTVRLMVYNSHARSWIHQFQRIFHLLEFDNRRPEDYKEASQFISDLCNISSVLRKKFAAVGSSTLSNRSRFSDTFFHVREARISFERWLTIFNEAGLKPYALFDRYGELDDLPNPLWKFPSKDELVARITDRRFENNFELYLCHTSFPTASHVGPSSPIPGFSAANWDSQLPLPTSLARFPSNWATFPETHDVRRELFCGLWQLHQQQTRGHRRDFFDELLIRQFPAAAIQRLARIGAILPQMLHTEELRGLAYAPMTDSMEVPQHDNQTGDFQDKYAVVVANCLLERKIFSEKLMHMIASRIIRASET